MRWLYTWSDFVLTTNDDQIARQTQDGHQGGDHQGDSQSRLACGFTQDLANPRAHDLYFEVAF